MKHEKLVERMTDKWLEEVSSLNLGIAPDRRTVKGNIQNNIDSFFRIIENMDRVTISRNDKGDFSVNIWDAGGRFSTISVTGESITHICGYDD